MQWQTPLISFKVTRLLVFCLTYMKICQGAFFPSPSSDYELSNAATWLAVCNTTLEIVG